MSLQIEVQALSMHQVLTTHITFEAWDLGPKKTDLFQGDDEKWKNSECLTSTSGYKCQTHMNGMFVHHFDISNISTFNQSSCQNHFVLSKLRKASASFPSSKGLSCSKQLHVVVTFKSNPWIPISIIILGNLNGKTNLGWHPHLTYRLPIQTTDTSMTLMLWSFKPQGWNGWLGLLPCHPAIHHVSFKWPRMAKSAIVSLSPCQDGVKKMWLANFQKLSALPPPKYPKHQDSRTE